MLLDRSIYPLKGFAGCYEERVGRDPTWPTGRTTNIGIGKAMRKTREWSARVASNEAVRNALRGTFSSTASVAGGSRRVPFGGPVFGMGSHSFLALKRSNDSVIRRILSMKRVMVLRS